MKKSAEDKSLSYLFQNRDMCRNENPNYKIFKPPKFDTDLKNYFYYTEVVKDFSVK